MCAVVIGSDKQRFELKDGKVRATYGHSFPVDLALEPVERRGNSIKSETAPFKRLEAQCNPHFPRRRYVFFLSPTQNTIGS